MIGGKVDLESLRSPHIESLLLFKQQQQQQQQQQKQQQQHQQQQDCYNNTDVKTTKYHPINRSARYDNIITNDNINDDNEKLINETKKLDNEKLVQKKRVIVDLTPEQKKVIEAERLEKAHAWLQQEKRKKDSDKTDLLKRKEVLKKLEQDIKQKLDEEAEARVQFNQEFIKNEFINTLNEKGNNTIASGSEVRSINQNDNDTVNNVNNNFEKKSYIRDISEKNRRALKLVVNTDINVANVANPLASPGVPIIPRRHKNRKDFISTTDILRTQKNDENKETAPKKVILKSYKKNNDSDDESDAKNKENIIDAKYNEEKQRRLQVGRDFAAKQRQARFKQKQDKQKEESEELLARREKLMLLREKSRQLATTKTVAIPANNMNKVTFTMTDDIVTFAQTAPTIDIQSPTRSPQSPSISPQASKSEGLLRHSQQFQQIHDSINANIEGSQTFSKFGDKSIYFDYTNQNVQYRTIFKPPHMKAATRRYHRVSSVRTSISANNNQIPKPTQTSKIGTKPSNHKIIRYSQPNIIRRTSFQASAYSVKPRRKVEKPKELKIEVTKLLDKGDIKANTKKYKNYIEIKYASSLLLLSLSSSSSSLLSLLSLLLRPTTKIPLVISIPEYTQSPQEPLDVVEKAQKNVEAVKHVISKVDQISSTLKKLTLDLESNNLFDRDSFNNGNLIVAARNSLSARLGLAFVQNNRYSNDDVRGSNKSLQSNATSLDYVHSYKDDINSEDNNNGKKSMKQNYDTEDSVLIDEEDIINEDEVEFIKDEREYDDRVRMYAADILEADQTWYPKTDMIEHNDKTPAASIVAEAIYNNATSNYRTQNIQSNRYDDLTDDDQIHNEFSYFNKHLLQNDEDDRIAKLEEAARKEATYMAKALDEQRAKVINKISSDSVASESSVGDTVVEYWDRMLTSPLRASAEPMIENSKLSMLLKQSGSLIKDDGTYSKAVIRDIDDASISSQNLAPSLRRATMLQNLRKSIDTVQSGIAKQALEDYREEMEQKLRLHEKNLKYKLHVMKANRLQRLAEIQQERRKLRLNNYGAAVRLNEYMSSNDDDINSRPSVEHLNIREAEIEKEYKHNRKEIEREHWAFRAYTYKELKKFKSLNEHIDDYENRLKGISKDSVNDKGKSTRATKNEPIVEETDDKSFLDNENYDSTAVYASFELSVEDRKKRIEDLNKSLQSLTSTRQKLAVVKARQHEDEIQGKFVEEEQRLIGLLHEETKRIEEEVADLTDATACSPQRSRNSSPPSSPSKSITTPRSSPGHSNVIYERSPINKSLLMTSPHDHFPVQSASQIIISPSKSIIISDDFAFETTSANSPAHDSPSKTILKISNEEEEELEELEELEEGLDVEEINDMIPKSNFSPKSDNLQHDMTFDSVKQVSIDADVDLDRFDSVDSASLEPNDKTKESSFDSYDYNANHRYENKETGNEKLLEALNAEDHALQKTDSLTKEETLNAEVEIEHDNGNDNDFYEESVIDDDIVEELDQSLENSIVYEDNQREVTTKIKEGTNSLTIETDIKNTSCHSEAPSNDSDYETIAWYRNNKKNHSARDKSQPLSPSSNHTPSKSPGKDHESILTESVDVSLDICNDSDDLSSQLAKSDENKFDKSDENKLDISTKSIDDSSMFEDDVNPSTVSTAITQEDVIDEHVGDFNEEDIITKEEIVLETNKQDDTVLVDDDENDYEEIEDIVEIDDDEYSIVDDVTDAILNKILINIQSNEEPNESLILEGNNVNAASALTYDKVDNNYEVNTFTDNTEDYDDNDLYEFDYDNKIYNNDDKTNDMNTSNDTIMIPEVPKLELINWKQNIAVGLSGMVNSLNIDSIMQYLDDVNITGNVIELDLNSSFIENMTEDVLSAWETHSDVLLDRIDELLRELKQRRHSNLSNNYQVSSPDSFTSSLVAKEMPLRADVIKAFIKERLTKEQDVSVDIITQKKYVLELVDVDIVEDINDEIDKRLRLTVSDIVDVILARLIVNTANSINTLQNDYNL